MPWTITAASVTGKSHQAQNTPCQDAHAALYEDHILLLAVADGAGSAPHGATGANIATQAALSFQAGALHGRRPRPSTITQLLHATVPHCRSIINQHAARHQHPMHDYATTLLTVIVTKSHIGILQIGDGAIVTAAKDGRLNILTAQQRREYVNEVTFLTCDEYLQELRITVRRHHELRHIALMTDGVETLGVRRASNTPHAGFFTPLFSQQLNSNDLAAFLDSPVVCERTDDDKTMIIATNGGTDALR